MSSACPKKIRKHKFGRKKYNIRWKKLPDFSYKEKGGKTVYYTLYGLCDPPSVKNRKIILNTHQGEASLLDSSIHEGFHALAIRMNHNKLTKSAGDIATFLWKMGWRLKKTNRGERITKKHKSKKRLTKKQRRK